MRRVMSGETTGWQKKKKTKKTTQYLEQRLNFITRPASSSAQIFK